MLKILRDNVKYLSWILWIIIGLFVAFVFVDFGTGIRQVNAMPTWAAKVGDQEITIAEYQRAARNLAERMRQMYGDQLSSDMLKQMRVPVQALNGAINEKILVAEAKRLGFSASDAEVRNNILAQGFKDASGNFIGEARYQEVMQRLGTTPRQFEDTTRQQVMVQKLLDSMRANVYVSDQEVERSYRDQVEKAKIRFLELPRGRVPLGQPVPQAELATWLSAHRQDFHLPEQREAAYLLLDPSHLRDQVKVEEGEIKAWYDAHHQDFSQQEQVRARQILVMVNEKKTDQQARTEIEQARQRVERGEDFGAVARQVSEDPASKPNGGDMGYFPRGRNIKEFEDAAFAAPQGKLVGPVKSAFGYHLIQVTDRKPGGLRPLDEVREQIRAQLSATRALDLAETRAKELAQKVSRAKPKSAESFAALANDERGAVGGTTARFSQADAVPGIGMAPAFNAAAFALKKDEISPPVQLPRGWAILYLKEIHPAHDAALNEVEPKVRQAVVAQKQQQAVMDKLAAERKQMAAGKTLDQVAAELGVQVQESPEFGGQGSIPGIGYSPQLTRAALDLAQGQVGGPILDPQGAVLFQVTEHKGWDPSKFAAARAQTLASLQQEEANRLLQSVIEQRRRDLGVTYNQRLLESEGLLQQGAGGPDGPNGPNGDGTGESS